MTLCKTINHTLQLTFFFIFLFFLLEKMESHLALSNKECKDLKFKRICVFGGRYMGSKDSYIKAAVALGRELVSRQTGLVYGGETDGLIGLVARTVNDAGGDVLGFTVKQLQGTEKIGELRVVGDLHQRKMEIINHADCFIALPGGFESMEGFSEVLSWAQIGIHDKPIGLVNVDGHFDYLMAFIDNAIEAGFVKASQKGLLVQSADIIDLFKKLEDYNPSREWALPKESWVVTGQSSSSSAEPK